MKKILLLSAAVALFAACSNDREQLASDGGPEVLVPLRISGNIDVSTQVTTRAVNDEWESGDAIGVYAVGAGTTTVLANGSGSNVQYSTTVSGTTSNGTVFKAFNAVSTPIYLPANGSAIDVYAYYPYSGSATTPGAIPIDVSTQDSQKAIDFMATGKEEHTTHDGSTTIKKTSPSCELLFAHKLSKLEFQIHNKIGSGVTNDEIATISAVTISGQKTSATYDLYHTGAGTANKPLDVSGVAAPLSAHKYADADAGSVTFEAIVLPNQNGSTEITNNPATDRTVTITLGPSEGQHETYTFTIPASTVFEPGYKYIYDVTVYAARLVVTAAITQWDNGGTKKYLTDGSHLSDLKTVLTSSGEVTAYSGMLGKYVLADGTISSSSASAIGQIAYMSDTDVDGADGTQKILVVSLVDDEIDDKTYSAAITAATGFAKDRPAGATVWALPTKDQMENIGSNLTTGDYWTQTEDELDDSKAYYWDGDALPQALSTAAKTSEKYVRPIFAY